MNKIFRRSLLALSTVSIIPAYLSLEPKADASYAQPVRRNPNDVIRPDWVGTWDCNISGRRVIMQLREVEIGNTKCEGNTCKTAPGGIGLKLAGRIGDSRGGMVRIEQRNFSSGDSPASQIAYHNALPLRYNKTDNWMLVMNPQNHNYANGYTTWRDRRYSLQCRK